MSFSVYVCVLFISILLVFWEKRLNVPTTTQIVLTTTPIGPTTTLIGPMTTRIGPTATSFIPMTPLIDINKSPIDLPAIHFGLAQTLLFFLVGCVSYMDEYHIL
jgi:hypothetical protein